MGIQPQNGSFVVETARGRIQARDVIVATSGYTGNVTPWQQHRIIPIGSYMIATEPLPHGVAEKLNPKERVISDTLDLVVYYRTCPQRKRLLFGGRVSLRETNPKVSAPRLRELMLQRFPELAAVKISHSWMGFVGYSFDHLPHIGKHNGIHYSMGYCGSGISLASYYGRMVGLKVAGDPEGETAIDRINFRGRPYYRGNPWFLAPSIFYYRWKDRLTAR
jgi:glycine/D-amino acid oxidase-like deaminating enzyme